MAHGGAEAALWPVEASLSAHGGRGGGSVACGGVSVTAAGRRLCSPLQRFLAGAVFFSGPQGRQHAKLGAEGVGILGHVLFFTSTRVFNGK